MTDTLMAHGSPNAREWTPDEATVRAIEVRAQVDSIESLHVQRRQLLITLAPLQALYGNFGLYDDRRKQLLEACKVRARATLSEGREKKPTETEIDANAYIDPDYVRLLEKAEADKIEYIHQANRFSEFEELIRSRDTELKAYTGEAQLQR